MNDRYYKFSRFLKEKYGEKVRKISIDAGFTCPNKDPLTGEGGCIFCRNDSFSLMQSLQNISTKEQIEKGIQTAKQRKGVNKYIIYFQSSTNTYAPVDVLRRYFMESIAVEGVVGLSIATRPDCLSDNVIELLDDLSRKTDLWLELGLQSSFDTTLKIINRGHTFQDYLNAVQKLSVLNLRICTHIMIGLPGESRRHIIETADKIALTGTQEVKIHPLLILKDTQLENTFLKGEIQELKLNEYVQLVCDFLERIPPTMVVQRLTAESPLDMLLAPDWIKNKMAVLRYIEQELKRRGSFQGSRFKNL
ncbi:TIGR01212 family radical SAM protein [candidate division KSB1 bacterium]|nr:TIGR01212 family radical SAM protein [candidate division KSB1 bacterium]